MEAGKALTVSASASNRLVFTVHPGGKMPSLQNAKVCPQRDGEGG